MEQNLQLTFLTEKLDQTQQQRNMSSTRELDKIPEELTEIEIGNLLKIRFRVII